MRPKFFAVVVTVIGGGMAVAQLRVTSFSPNGDLTWTNSVTNAVYRLQWATNPSGPWNPFTTPTNLNSIQAHSNRVTVNVPIAGGADPQFLRPGWADPAPATGLYDLREYDQNGILLVTGSLWLAGESGSAIVSGTRTLVQVSGPPGYPGPQLGPCDGADHIGGALNAPYAEFNVALTPDYNDNNVYLYGFLVGNTFQGDWEWNTGGASPIHNGWFTATRAHCDPPPPPSPAGTWDYRTFVSGWAGRGQLTFATNGCSITGTWDFTQFSPKHLLGQGSFTNVAISENSVTITIPVGDTAFELKGVMASGFYVGFVQWATNNVPMGFRETALFWARRQ